MACQISYDRLNKLFFDSIAFDPKYKSYREMANRIFSMSLTKESKVTAVWYMGLLYNNAIPMDKEIRTEDLPRAVAVLVADKIGDESADFIDLYDKIQEVFKPKPADEADLSGGVKTEITDKGVISNGDKIINVKTKPVTNEITETAEDLFILPDKNPEGRIHINMEPLKDILVVPNNTLTIIDKTTGKEIVNQELNPEGAVIFEAMQGRLFVVANINGQLVPFYKSSAGTSGKIEGDWYPFFGYTGSWLVKGTIDKATGKMNYSAEIDRVTTLLNENLVFPDKYLNRVTNTIKNTKGEVIIDMNKAFKINRLWQKAFQSQTGTNTNYQIKGLKDNTRSESGVVALITGLNTTELDSSKTPKENAEWLKLINSNIKSSTTEGKPVTDIKDLKVGTKLEGEDYIYTVVGFNEKGAPKVERVDKETGAKSTTIIGVDRLNEYFKEGRLKIIKEEGKPEVTEEKPLTLKEKINEEFKKISSASATEVNDIFNKIYNLTKNNPELTLEDQVKVFDKLKSVITKNIKQGKLSESYRVKIQTIIDEYSKKNTTGAIDYGEVEGVGKDMYVIRQQDGTLFQAKFDEVSNKYYKVDFLDDSLTEYEVRDTDYITPIYYRTKTRVTVDSSATTVIKGDLSKNGIAFSSEGTGLNQRLASQRVGWQDSNIELLRKNLRKGASVFNQVRVIADKRRTNLNRERSLKYGIKYEHTLRSEQIDALNNNPDLPVVSFLLQKSGPQFTIENKYAIGDYNPGDLFSYITSLDNLGFVYASGEVRPIDWNNKMDLALLTKTLKVEKFDPALKRYIIDFATPQDIQKYKEVVSKIKQLKQEIEEDFEGDDNYELSPEQVRQYFSIVNVAHQWLNTKGRLDDTKTKPLADIKDELVSVSSTITAKVGKKVGITGKIGSISNEEVIGIVRSVDGRLEFENSLGKNLVVLDENDQPLKGGIKTLFINEGLNESSILKTLNQSFLEYGYLVKTLSGWNVRPLKATTYVDSELDKIGVIASLSGLIERLPEYSPETAKLYVDAMNSFSENAWGFNEYKGLAASFDYRQKQFIVSVRAKDNYEYAAGLKDTTTVGRFDFNFDYETGLQELKQIAKGLNLKYNPNATSEEKIAFSKELQTALKKAYPDAEELQRIISDPKKSNPLEVSISNLIKEYNVATRELHAEVKKAIETHQKKVGKGETPYMDSDGAVLEQLLFNTIGDPSSFKVRDNTTRSNPLLRFRTFDEKVGGDKPSVINININKSTVINPDVTATVVPDIPSAPVQESSNPKKVTKVTKEKRDETWMLVDSLKGLKIIGDDEWNGQLDEVRRMLGETIKVTDKDLSNLDVTGKALGYYENRVITLNNKLKVGGVAFHEAFHAIFRTALKSEKRTELLTNASLLYGPVKEDFKGLYLEHNGKKVYFDEFRQNRRYMGLSDEFTRNLILEEFLADGFRDYKLNKTEPKNGLIKLFYRAIDALIKLFNSKKYEAAKSIQNFYAEIDNGSYAGVIGDEITSYPRAYELIDIPSYLYLNENEEPVLKAETVSVELHNQLKNRVLHELFARASEIKNDKILFNKVYDEVTKDLIQEFNLERYFDENNSKFRSQITDKYASDFRAMRYILGAAHREDVREVFSIKNLTDSADYDNYTYTDPEELAESEEAFENFKNEVFKEYVTVEVAPAAYSDEAAENEAGEGDMDEEGAPNLESKDESEVGENFRDDGILTFSPYDGDSNFQKLIRYIKYSYTDRILGITYTKMVNSKTIINTIRKLVLNTAFDKKLPAIREHIDLLKRNIDAFYENAELLSELDGVIPTHMIKMQDDYDQINSVMKFITDMGGLDENYNVTKESGRQFVNMFHHVFNYSSAEIDAISAFTSTEQLSEKSEEDSYSTVYRKVDLLKKEDVERALDSFQTDIAMSLSTLREVPEVLQTIRDSYQNWGEYDTDSVPRDEDSFNETVNSIYKATTLAQLNIPRYLIEFSVAADMYKILDELDTDVKDTVKSIIDSNKQLYNESKYFDTKSFISDFKNLFDSNSETFNDDNIIGSKVEKLVETFAPSIPLQLQYDPSSFNVIVRNLDGKAISRVIPNVPSVEIVNQIKNKGLRPALERVYGKDFISFFYDNPYLRAALLENWKYKPNATTPEDIEKNRIHFFLEELKVSVSGGLTQNIKGSKRQKRSTFKSLGNKSYMLSLLGLFANRKQRSFQGNKVITFTRPITQLEATSTQFNITALYDSYHKDGALNTDLIASKFKQAIKQEWTRIKNEWRDRYVDKPRREDFNAKTIITEEDARNYGVKNGTIVTDDPKLRAYTFSNSKDFFDRNETSRLIGKLLEESARAGVLSFESALDQVFTDSDQTIGEILTKELVGDKDTLPSDQEQGGYSKEVFDDLYNYLTKLGISLDDFPSSIFIDKGVKNKYGKLEPTVEPIIQRTKVGKDEKKGKVLRAISDENRTVFLEDFLYNFWFNSLFINQIFDGDIAVGIKDIITYFKRQKSGVAAGPNYRNYSINEEEDYTNAATLQELFGYLNEENIEDAVEPTNRVNKKRVNFADGMGYTTLERRLKKFAKSGLLPEELREALAYARIGFLTRREQEILESHDIILNSDKPVAASPYNYVKDSEHIILRGSVSVIHPDDRLIVLDLYDQLDGIDSSTPEGLAEYKELIKTIHQYFTPAPDTMLLHTLLNSMEYHMRDLVTDQSATKKGSTTPTLVNIAALDDYSEEGHPVVTKKIKDENGNIVIKEIPMMEKGYTNVRTGKPVLYINLAHSSSSIPNELMYDQMYTAGASGETTDGIQEKLMLSAQLDDPKFSKRVKDSLKELRIIESEIATARQEIVNRLINGGNGDPATLLTKIMQSGLLSQGASTNLLKLYGLNSEGKNNFNLNLPIHGKAPSYYFFSLFNNNLFGPKVAGEKFFHVSNLGYKLIFDKATGEQISQKELRKEPLKYADKRLYEARYPKVIIEDDRIVVECMIPKKLGKTPEDTQFFEKLYGDYLLGTRIPTELKRSMVVIKVVGYLDAAHSNSIVVPPQVHLWAGSDLDIDSLYTKTFAYYRNSLGELVKYGDLNPYTDIGLSQQEASFVEFLHFMSEDAGFRELIDLENLRIQSNSEYRSQSLVNGASIFGMNIAQYFDASEELSHENIGKRLKKLIYGNSFRLSDNTKVKFNSKEAEVLRLVDRLSATINVLNEYEILGRNKKASVENFTAYVKRNGNPTTPALQNRALVLKTEILSDPLVYDTFTRNFSADDAIEPYKENAKLLENISEGSKLKKSSMFVPQTLGRARGAGRGSKRMVGGNAATAKTVVTLSTVKAKVSSKYVYDFNVENNKGKYGKVKTNMFTEQGPILVSNSIGFATDDGKNQFAEPLNLFINNASVMNYLYALGYHPQFALLLSSVDSIKKASESFENNNDPGYVTPGKAGFSFTTTVNQELALAVTENLAELKKLGIVTIGDKTKKAEYIIDKDQIVIGFTPVSTQVENRLPSSLGIKVMKKDGTILPDSIASIALLHFYNEILKLSNTLNFNFGPITDVGKKLNPSWQAIERINNAAKFVEDNDVFEGGNIRSFYKAYPAIETLVKDGIAFMTQTSKKMFLDQTYMFRGITSLFKADREITEDEVILQLKSIIGLQVLAQYVKNETSKADFDKNQSNRAKVLRILSRAFTTDYWVNNSAPSDLRFLKKKFPNNEFLKSLRDTPALRKPLSGKDELNVIVSNIGSKVSPEQQETLMNDFYFLLNNADSEVHDAAVNIAMHGIIKDGAMSRQEGYLKIIAPEMFTALSQQLDNIQDIFYDLDTDKKKIDTPEKYIELLNKGLSKAFTSTVTINQFMKAVLNKMVSSFTYDVTGDPTIQMSFWEGSETLPNKGAFSDMDRRVFANIVDKILPKNSRFVYRVSGKNEIVALYNLSYNGESNPKSKFELWKGDEKGELFFDLRTVDSLNKPDELTRILRKQGIYKSENEYVFPLYKVNNFEQGQIFIIEELDGKPVTENLFKNLFNSYKSTGETVELLKGMTAKYKIYNRQGLDRISPNGLTSETAIELFKVAKGQRSITSEKVKSRQFPKGIITVASSGHLLVKDNDIANEIKDKKYIVNNQELDVKSYASTYKLTLNRATGKISVFKKGKSSFTLIYSQQKEEVNQKEFDEFLKKLGIVDIQGLLHATSDIKKIMPEPGKISEFQAIKYYSKPAPIEKTGTEFTDTPEKSQAEEIYSKLGKVTKTPNIIIDDVAGRKASTKKGIVAYRTRGNNFLEAFEKDRTIGNPWSHAGYSLYKTNTVKDAVIQFTKWLTGEAHTDVLQDYRQAILDNLDNLKGRKIIYYEELNQPSHATALDYLINKYDWGTEVKPEEDEGESVKIISQSDIDAYNQYVEKSDGKMPKEFFTANTRFKEFYNKTTGKREKAPQSSKWILQDNDLYDLTDMETGEVYISNVDLRTGMKMTGKVTESKDKRPEFDKLPGKSATPTMTYAGIGSRETPEAVLELMTQAAEYLEKQGFTLNTGKTFLAKPSTDPKYQKQYEERLAFSKKHNGKVGLDEEGADRAFSLGATKKNLFGVDKPIGQREMAVMQEIHPNPGALKEGAKKLMARNTNQVFGENLDTPVDFVLFYAEEVPGSIRPKGGTGQAVEMARRKGIPTINMADPNWRQQLTSVLNGIKLSKLESSVKVVSSDYGVVVAETNPSMDKTKSFVNLIQPQIKKQAYKENEGTNANDMFMYGLRWTRKSKAFAPLNNKSYANKGLSINDAKATDPYVYDTVDQNKKPLPSLEELQPIIYDIQNALNLDMSAYDAVIGNIYLPGQNISIHRDTTESLSARNYPVIVYTIGNDSAINIYENEKQPGAPSFARDKKTSIPTKDGTIYTFGMDGKGRFELAHDTPKDIKRDKKFPPITLPNGDVITNYTITLTFRRVKDLGPYVPTSPGKIRGVETEPTTEPGVTIEQVKELFESNPSLANDVYDAAGFKKKNIEEYRDVADKQTFYYLDKIKKLEESKKDFRNITDIDVFNFQKQIKISRDAPEHVGKYEVLHYENGNVISNYYNTWEEAKYYIAEFKYFQSREYNKLLFFTKEDKLAYLDEEINNLVEKASQYQDFRKYYAETLGSEITSKQKRYAQEMYFQYLQTTNNPSITEFKEFISSAKSGVTETTIEYTPVGKQRQTYTIRGNQVFNKAGQEVFKEDSVDRNKIFANLAVQQGRAVVVEHKSAKYVVNNKDQIISATTGKIMKWDENNGDRKAIIASAKEKFAAKKDQDNDNDVTDNNIFNC